MGYWDIITPKSARNYHKNPSLEKDTTTYAARFGGTLTRTAALQKRGAWAGQYTPTATTTDGVKSSFSVPAPAAYVASVDFQGSAGLGYQIRVFDLTGPTQLGFVAFTASGGWDRPQVAFTSVSGHTGYEVQIIKDSHASVTAFYFDGLLIEDGTVATTYFDGDSEGCVWISEPHRSPSIRPENAPGGTITNFDDIDNLQTAVLAQAGTGVAPVDNQAITPAGAHGSRWQRSLAKARTFTLKMWLEGQSGFSDLLQKRRNLLDFLYPGRRFGLRYRGGQTPVTINAVYDAGFELGDTSGYVEMANIRFIAHQPFWESEGESGATLTMRTTSGSGFLTKKEPDGTVKKLISTATGNINAVCVLPDGRIAFGGSVGTYNGVSCPGGIGIYDEATGLVTSIATGITAGIDDTAIFKLAVSPTGYLYAAGDFASLNGVANTRSIARYLLSTGTWSAMPTLSFRPTRPIVALMVQSTGYVWMGLYGDAFNNLIYNDGADFISPLDIYPQVNSIIERNGIIYFGGEFLNFNIYAQELRRIAQITYPYNNGTIFPMGTGLDTNVALSMHPGVQVLSMTTDNAGLVYVTGNFDRANDDTSITGQAIWNGTTWLKWFDGQSFSNSRLVTHPSGEVWLSNETVIDGINRLNATQRYTGSVFFEAGLTSWADAVFTPEGAGYFAQGPAASSAITQVFNTATADANPLITIRGPGSLGFIRNGRTGVEVQFKGLDILDGEYVTLELGQRGQNTLTSSARGDLTRYLVPGSRLASLVLLPGANPIECYMDTGTIVSYDSAKVTATIVWKNLQWSVDGSMP